MGRKNKVTVQGTEVGSIDQMTDNEELIEVEDSPGDDPIADVEDLSDDVLLKLQNGTCAHCTEAAVWRVERTKEYAEDTCRQHAGPAHTYLTLHAL